jgi:NSS family neurotransmitter:Na+ symporter
MKTGKEEQRWGTRLGFLLSAVGAMVGAGNIWRFPRLLAMYGGGVFLIPYTLALFIVAIPLLIAEGIIGRSTGKGTILGFVKYGGGNRYAWAGIWILWVNVAILSYYSVITGWGLAYVVKGFAGLYTSYAPGKGLEVWNTFIGGWQPLFFTIVVWLFAWYVMAKGVRGIEKINTLMVPSLILLLVIISIMVVAMPGADIGLEYIFDFDVSKLSNPQVWVQAFSQVLWSTGAGWGIYTTYSSYLKRGDDIVLNSHITGFSDSSASLLASIAVVVTVAITAPVIGINPFKIYAEGNVGLTYIWLTELFPIAPAGFVLGIFFYLAFFFAAFCSLIGISAVLLRNIVDFGVPRKKAVTRMVVICLCCGIPAAISLNWLNNQDWVWSNALLISSIIFSLLMVKTGLSRNREEANRGSDLRIGRWWEIFVGYISPVTILAVLSWWIIDSIKQHPGTWWKVTDVYSVGTFVVQCLLAVLAIWIFSKTLIPKISTKLKEEET